MLKTQNNVSNISCDDTDSRTKEGAITGLTLNLPKEKDKLSKNSRVYEKLIKIKKTPVSENKDSDGAEKPKRNFFCNNIEDLNKSAQIQPKKRSKIVYKPKQAKKNISKKHFRELPSDRNKIHKSTKADNSGLFSGLNKPDPYFISHSHQIKFDE